MSFCLNEAFNLNRHVSFERGTVTVDKSHRISEEFLAYFMTCFSKICEILEFFTNCLIIPSFHFCCRAKSKTRK